AGGPSAAGPRGGTRIDGDGTAPDHFDGPARPGQALVENTPTVRRTTECNTPVTSWRSVDTRRRWPLTAGQTTSIGRYSTPRRSGVGRRGPQSPRSPGGPRRSCLE